MGCPGDKLQTGDLLLAFLGPWHPSSPCLSFPTCSCGSWESATGYGRCCRQEEAPATESTQTGLQGIQEEDSAGVKDPGPLPPHQKDYCPLPYCLPPPSPIPTDAHTVLLLPLQASPHCPGYSCPYPAPAPPGLSPSQPCPVSPALSLPAPTASFLLAFPLHHPAKTSGTACSVHGAPAPGTKHALIHSGLFAE